MNYTIQTAISEPPEQRVQLDLSIKEFALIYALNYRYSGGDPQTVRGAVSDGLDAALRALHPTWATKVRDAAPKRSLGFPAEDVEEVFAS